MEPDDEDSDEDEDGDDDGDMGEDGEEDDDDASDHNFWTNGQWFFVCKMGKEIAKDQLDYHVQTTNLFTDTLIMIRSMLVTISC